MQTCNIICSVQSLDFNIVLFKLINFKKKFLEKGNKSTDDIYARRTSNVSLFLALSLMPSCQTAASSHNNTFTGLFIASRYHFACNKSLLLWRGEQKPGVTKGRPLDVSASSSHEFKHSDSEDSYSSQGFKKRKRINPVGWDSGCRVTPLLMNTDLTLLYQFNIYFLLSV